MNDKDIAAMIAVKVTHIFIMNNLSTKMTEKDPEGIECTTTILKFQIGMKFS